ncbi:MAG: solute carrier 26 family protein [Bacteroidetes bacterium]|nr:solute carrier 26 family protein [Bacteroidota bacterium]
MQNGVLLNFKSFVPILDWLPKQTWKSFRADLIAGLTVGVMLVPQGMAYAMLAGMPPIYGLYGGVIPLVIYAFFGSSIRLSLGPVAVSSLLILAGISQVAEPFSQEYVQLVLLTGLLIGILKIILSFLRLGFLVNFLSQPVVLGFISAAAVIILISQLKDLFGIYMEPGLPHPSAKLQYIWAHLDEIHWITFAIGAGGIFLILLLSRINKRLPSALIAMIIGILVVRIFRLDQAGVSIVGEVPKGLPGFLFPRATMEQIQAIMPTVFTVTLIGIMESISIAKFLESKHRDHTIRPNQELLALGLSKIFGSFFQAIPTSASFTRSAINDESGAKSQLSGIITAVLIGLTLAFLTPLFYYLPNALLASVILVAVGKLFHWKAALHYWKVYRSDFFMMIITFLVTLLLGVEQGVLAGVILSIVLMVYRSSRPHVAILGMIPGTNQYRNVARFPKALQDEEILILRFDAPLFFGNANYFKDAIMRRVRNRKNLKMVLLDASSIYDLDGTGMDALTEVVESIRKEGITFYISGVLGPVRDRLFRSGLMENIGELSQFLNVHRAVQAYKASDKKDLWVDAALQTNAEKKQGK